MQRAHTWMIMHKEPKSTASRAGFKEMRMSKKRQQLEYPERRKRVLTERTREFVLSNPVNKQVSIPRHVRYTVRRAPEPQRVYLGGLTLPGSLSFVTTVRVQKDARQNTQKKSHVYVYKIIWLNAHCCPSTYPHVEGEYEHLAVEISSNSCTISYVSRGNSLSDELDI